MLPIVPLILALIIAEFSTQTALATGFIPLVQSLALGLGAWLLVQAMAGWLLRGQKAIKVMIWSVGSIAGTLALHYHWCMHFGMVKLVPIRAIALLPIIALLLIHWRCMLIGRMAKAEANAAVWNRFRLVCLPILAAVVLLDALHVLVVASGLEAMAEQSLLTQASLGVILMLTLLSILPLIVSRLWRTRPMPAGPQRDLIESGCQRFGIRYKRCHVWPAGRGRFYNAAVLGPLPATRFLLFSEDLLKELTPDQLRAVLGHELGHIRHRHLWSYLIFLALCAALAGQIAFLIANTWFTYDPDRAIIELISMLIVMSVLMFFGFGHLSRRCERQADLAGAELAGSPAHMQSALQAVARLSGQAPEAFSWMHGSIAERIRYLEHVSRDPGLIPWYHRYVMKLRLILILCLAMAFVLTVMQGMQQNKPPSMDWVHQDQSRSEAWKAALAGDSEALYRYLVARDSSIRRRVALLILDRFEKSEDMRKEGTTPYQERFLLMPFTNLRTGGNGDSLDLAVDNMLAYILVAGTTQPTSDDISLAEKLLPRLDQAASDAKRPLPGVMDTVGSIHFVAGRIDKAREVFSHARKIVTEEVGTGEPSKRQQKLLDILDKRLLACDTPGADLPADDEIPIFDPTKPSAATPSTDGSQTNETTSGTESTEANTAEAAAKDANQAADGTTSDQEPADD